MPGEGRPRVLSYSHLLTLTACAMCVVLTAAYHLSVYARGGAVDALGLMGYRPVHDIWAGSYGALLTAVFVHGTPHSPTSIAMHLGFNLLYLYVLSTLLEETIHPLLWVLFFVGASVVSSGAEIALSSRAGVGVSGVVYAMFGLLWAGRRQYPKWRLVATRQNLAVMVGWGLFCILATWLNWIHVANAAHFGGLAFGFAAGWFFVGRRPWLSSLVLLGLAALTVASVLWMPWSLPWTEWKAQRERSSNHPAAAIYWYRRALALGAEPGLVWSNILVTEHMRGNEAGQRAAEAELERLGVLPVSEPFRYRFVAPPIPGMTLDQHGGGPFIDHPTGEWRRPTARRPARKNDGRSGR